ncbi:PPP family 3-phenylpropionic acid transporter [Fluviicoccus keumensis]|uniref:PPP family 3-phenylpropionic acid transporter n=1 Tax=Fluviicoccus keumensis TaxID=1435465 RepID=A0A4Q7ZAG9_9GAMM|nr:MFS transporter [Fluviicoccus keumensis]RZU47081.1 PPP family 3-phenylpropionic acid transporter [Fluviicoccus keumensis]
MTVQKLPYWRLSLFYFFYFAVLGGYMPYWGLYLDNLKFSAAEIGQLTAIGMLTRIFAPNFWGWLADSTGKRIELVRFGALMICFFWAGIFFVGSDFRLMAMVLFAYSFFQNAILAQFEAVTIAHLGAERSRYGNIRLWGSLGFIATVAGFGYLFDRLSVHYLPALLLASAVIAALFSLAVPHPPAMAAHRSREPFLHTLRKRPVAGFFVVHFLLQLSHAPYYGFFSLYLEAHGYSRGVIGLLWSLGVLAEVLAFTRTHWLLARFSETGLVLACLALAALRWLVIGWGVDHPVLVWSVQVFHAFSFAVFHAAAMQLIFREFSPGQQGQGQAVYSALWGLGVALGSWLAGAAWLQLGAAWVYTIAAAVCVTAILILIKTRPGVPDPVGPG